MAWRLHDHLVRAGKPFPWHWGNGFYLEWFSHANGRVVIESADYELRLESVGAWTLAEEDGAAGRGAAVEQVANCLESLGGGFGFEESGAAEEEDEDADLSELEREADEETARMDLLLDRVQARLERIGDRDADTLERVMEEERERLRRERGEPEPEPPAWEEIEAQERWLDKLHEVEEAAMRELEENPDAFPEPGKHPLAERCYELSIRLWRECNAAGWLDGVASMEHPLQELVDGVQIASAKLAGALNSSAEDGSWPPPDYAVGDTLVRLKKARGHLRDALDGARAARGDGLAAPEWLEAAEREAAAVLEEVRGLIAELRRGLQ